MVENKKGEHIILYYSLANELYDSVSVHMEETGLNIIPKLYICTSFLIHSEMYGVWYNIIIALSQREDAATECFSKK